jgi:hypothetical protein
MAAWPQQPSRYERDERPRLILRVNASARVVRPLRVAIQVISSSRQLLRRAARRLHPMRNSLHCP